MFISPEFHAYLNSALFVVVLPALGWFIRYALKTRLNDLHEIKAKVEKLEIAANVSLERQTTMIVKLDKIEAKLDNHLSWHLDNPEEQHGPSAH